MIWNIDSDRPVYRQLVEQIQYGIIAGEYQPGDKLPSVRDLAADAAVNPNTMQRALSTLEGTGLVYSQRTAGRFITEDKKMIEGIKETMAIEEIKAFIDKMAAIGLDKDDVITLMDKIGGNHEQ